MKIQSTITIDKHKLKIPAKFPDKLIERRIMMYLKKFAAEDEKTVEELLDEIKEISLMIRPLDDDLYAIYVAFWYKDGYLIMKPLLKYSDDYTDIAFNSL